MKKIINKYKFLFSFLLFFLISLIYEISVFNWSKDVFGPIIRVDIMIVYPIISIISVLFFFVLKKLSK